MSNYDYQKIEPCTKRMRAGYDSTGTFDVIGYGTYPRSSVLAGQQRRVFLDNFPTIEAAQKAYPNAKVGFDSGVRASVSPVPEPWFDESVAGESWDPV